MVRPARRRIKAAIAACVGALIILSVVWNVVLYTEYFAPVYFDWNADTGFTRISVTPPGRKVGPLTRVLAGLIAVEARPFVGRDLRSEGWKSASGQCYVRLLPFPPLVYGVSRLTEPWKIIDPEVTPLMQAAELDRLELVKIELAAGADVNARDQRAWTPLMHACMTRLASSEVVQTLISAGADVNAKDKVGRTPLIWAIKYLTNKAPRDNLRVS